MAELTANGARLHVQLLGNGEARVIFLHGLVMDNLSSWYFTVANPVARSARVLLYDLRGHGRSQRTPKGYRVRDMVADLHALRAAAAFDDRPALLVGNSFGGLLAVSYALAHPKAVAGVALVDGQLADAAWANEMRATLELEGAERDRMIAESFKAWLGRHSERKRTRLARTASELVYRTSLVPDLIDSELTTDQRLRTLDVPALGIYGADSDALRHGERMAAVVDGFELRRYPGCTHSVLWERTEKVKAELASWIAARAGGC
jgi:pimeloyl-ACP methyl ester carboxylesterase